MVGPICPGQFSSAQGKKKKKRNGADVQVCQDGMRKYESDAASPLVMSPPRL